MNKKRKVFLIVLSGVLLLVTLVVLSYTYFYPNNKGGSSSNGGGTALKNPVEGLSDQEAVLNFNESFIFYLLYSIRAYNLHNPPFSSDTPKIEIRVGEEIFYGEIVKNRILIGKGSATDEDIVIETTRDEAVKMLRSRSYIEQSFSDGKSGFIMVSDKLELFSKGYLNLYKELTGKSAN